MKQISLCIAIATLLILNSCGGNIAEKTKNAIASGNTSANDINSLKAFMLGGIYFTNGYGGIEEVTKMVGSSDNKKIIEKYNQLYTFPFNPKTDAAGARSTLQEWWEIESKEGLTKVLDKLKNGDPKSKHKAWDYARLTNNACMGYAAGFLTKEEATKFITDALPLAQKNFKTWDDYFTDWNAGRKEWGGDTENAATFEELSKTITKDEKSIYKILPLN